MIQTGPPIHVETIWELRQGDTDREKESHLGSFAIHSIHDGLVCRLAETAVDAGLFIVREPSTEAFWSIVESVTERLMDALDGVSASHKDL